MRRLVPHVGRAVAPSGRLETLELSARGRPLSRMGRVERADEPAPGT